MNGFQTIARIIPVFVTNLIEYCTFYYVARFFSWHGNLDRRNIPSHLELS